MDQKTKQEQSTSSMSGQSGSSDSSKYEYWKEKTTGKIYACRVEQGQSTFHGPLSSAQINVSPEGFTYTTNQEIASRPTDFIKLSYEEAQKELKNTS